MSIAIKKRVVIILAGCLAIGLVALLFYIRKNQTTNKQAELSLAKETNLQPSSNDNKSIQVQQELHENVKLSEKGRAFREGAKGKITLRVVDSKGTPVSSASVEVNFAAGGKNNSNIKGITATDGLFACEGLSNSDCNIYVNKEGYYRTTQRYSFVSSQNIDGVKDGRWHPWNPTIEVMLKEKRCSIKGIVGRTNIKIPKDTVVGFDCVKGDWQPPIGQGVNADIIFLYRSEYNGVFGYLTNSLTMSTQGAYDGFAKLKQDSFSKYWSIYDAHEDGYQSPLIFEMARTMEKIYKDFTVNNDEYLVFCSTRENGNKYYGKIINFEYGEDYKKPKHGFIKFSYYINPIPNDRRLEIEK